jgi:hypothetical protein
LFSYQGGILRDFSVLLSLSKYESSRSILRVFQKNLFLAYEGLTNVLKQPAPCLWTRAEKKEYKMKKLFYRLSSRRLFAKFFSLLAIAIAASAVATESQAQWGSGGASWFGSDFTAVIKLGEYSVNVLTSPSVCGTGFIDTFASTDGGQATDCTLIENGVETPRLCQFTNLQCSCFQVPTCTSGTRTGTMTCPTLDPTAQPKENLAGCTGQITVLDLNGNQVPSLPGHPNPINIGSIPPLEDLTSPGQCKAQFPGPKPGTTGLPENVMGTLTQECSTGDITEQIVRSTNGFKLSTPHVLDANQATCNPANGFPTNACTNDSGAFITFAATANECVESNFSCGEFTGESGPVDGPPPSKCTFDKKSGQCQCRCARCTPQGALVNVGLDQQGIFVLHSAQNAYGCQVRVVH